LTEPRIRLPHPLILLLGCLVAAALLSHVLPARYERKDDPATGRSVVVPGTYHNVPGLFTPLAHLPVAASAVGMLVAHTLIHVPVPSVSGPAVLTIPILVPLSDLLGLSRQVTVLAYQ